MARMTHSLLHTFDRTPVISMPKNAVFRGATPHSLHPDTVALHFEIPDTVGPLQSQRYQVTGLGEELPREAEFVSTIIDPHGFRYLWRLP